MVRNHRRSGTLMPIALLVCVVAFPEASANADYRLYALSDGCDGDRIDPGDTIEVALWLTSDNEDESNSIIVQIAFSSPGWMYSALTWHGIYAGSIYDDSTPNGFPVVLTADLLEGPGHPVGVVDVELSNVAIEPYCVGPGNAGAGPCECPGGACIGGQCVGGAHAGLSCTESCPAEAACVGRFTDGLVATLALTVPPDFGASDMVMVEPVVDMIANGFVEIPSSAAEGLAVYLACVAAGDVDCDGAVTLADYDQWATCLTGAGGNVSPECEPFDFDDDDDVDLIDWGALQSGFDSLCSP